MEGGIVTYDDNLGSNQLRLTFDNTSSSWNGAITGIVFNVSTNITAASILSFVDGSGNAITGWTVGMNVNNETLSSGNTVFDIAFETTNGINGGIYNDGVATNFSNVVPDIATLILTVTIYSWTLSSIDSDSILRMQRTGANGGGSLKIVTSSSSSSGTSGQSSSGNNIPEPGMLALLCAGLLGQALLIRQRRRRQE